MTIARALIIAAVLFFFGRAVFAEVGVITVAASVRAFDEKTVVLQINGRRIRVPRDFVRSRNLKAGDAVLLTLRGEQIKYLVDHEHEVDSDGRSPASNK